MSLKGKHALVTGSSRGIGRGIVLKLAENGVKVAIHYVQNEAAAKDTLAKVRKLGSDGFTVQADVQESRRGIRRTGHFRQQRAPRGRRFLSGAAGHHPRAMGHRLRLSGEGVSGGSQGSYSLDE